MNQNTNQVWMPFSNEPTQLYNTAQYYYVLSNRLLEELRIINNNSQFTLETIYWDLEEIIDHDFNFYLENKIEIDLQLEAIEWNLELDFNNYSLETGVSFERSLYRNRIGHSILDQVD